MKRQAINLNDNNIELYIFQLKEGLLDDAAKKAVEQALEGNKEWQELAEMYEPSLQLPKYPHLVYADKEKLRTIAKPVARRGIVIPIWSRVAAACAIIVGIILFIRIGNGDKTNDNILASNNITETTDTTPTQIVPEETIIENNSIQESTSPRHLLKNVPQSATMIAENQTEAAVIESNECCTKSFVTFLDDNDTSYDYLLLDKQQIAEQQPEYQVIESPIISIEYTESLITFVDDNVPDYKIPYKPHPEWRTTVDDFSSRLQIARLEFQTTMVTRLNRRLKVEN